MFATNTAMNGTTTVVDVIGELDLATAPELRRAVTAACEGAARTLVLDLARLSFTDSTGISAISAATARAAEQGISVMLRNPSERLRQTLTILGLDRTLPLEVASSG